MASLLAQVKASPALGEACGQVQQAGEWFLGWVDARAAGLRPYQIGVASVLLYMVLRTIVNALWQEEPLFSRLRSGAFAFVRNLPYVREYVDAQLEDQLETIANTLFKPKDDESFVYALPASGVPAQEVTEMSRKLCNMGDYDWEGGKVSGAVYHGGRAWRDAMAEIMRDFMWSNALHADVFPGVRKMEAEVVSMVLNMFHGGPTACGCVTAGGTDSILMACLAYRNRARERGITRPNMVVPETLHAAFDKAAGYYGIHLIHVPVDEETRQADVAAMAARINRNTIAIAGSCPQYPHGIIDPIEELSALALRHNIGCHVDCCLGGFLVAFMEDAGFELPLFDFRLPGVTSISCDTHKYGYSPKGTSVIMYNDFALRRHQFFVAPNWPGGIYASPGAAGSRPGNVIAATWAAMLMMGRDGYVDATRRIVSATRWIADECKSIEGVFVYGASQPLVSVVALGSNHFSIYKLSSAMGELGWNLSSCQKPASIHLALTLRHTSPEVAQQFVDDLRTCATALLASDNDGPATGMGAIYGMAETIPDPSLVVGMAKGFLDIMLRVDPRNKFHSPVE